MEPIDELKNEIEKLRGTLVERERRIKNVDAELVRMKRSIDRVAMLIDGSEEYNIIGIVDRIDRVQSEVDKIVKQKDNVKWAIVGVLIITSLGNASSIMSLAKLILFP